MKIVIRPGLVNPDIYVVHPVNDKYGDIGAFDKVNLKNEDAYQAFLELLALSREELRQEAFNIDMLQFSMDLGGSQEKCLAKRIVIDSRNQSEFGEIVRWVKDARRTKKDEDAKEDAKQLHNMIDERELKNLKKVIGYLERMKSGDSGIEIENWLENPPKHLAKEIRALRKRREKGSSGGELPGH